MGCNESKEGERENTGALPDAHEAAKTLERRRWMTRFGSKISDAKLQHLSMVGAHDAAAYNIAGNHPVGIAPDAPEVVRDIIDKAGAPAVKVVSDWARTQDRSILQQLNHGVRYFDIRLGPKSGDTDLWVCHGLFSVPFPRVVEDVAAFYSGGRVGYRGAPLDFDIEENQEIIILDVQKCEGHDGPNGDAINDGFFKMLEPIKPLCMTPRIKLHETIGQIQKSGVRVVVLYPNDPACRKFGLRAIPRGLNIRSHWKNKNTVEEIKPLLVDELALCKKEQEEGGGANIQVLQAVLTSDTELIVKGLLLPDFAAPDSVEVLARKVNDDAMEVWVGANSEKKEEALKTGEPGAATVLDGRNVLMLDFCERGTFEGLDAVQLSHFLNVRKFGAPEDAKAVEVKRPEVPSALCAFPEFAELLGDAINLHTPSNQRLLTVWGGDGTPVRMDAPEGNDPDADIWTWFIIVVDEHHVALRCTSGAFLRVVDDVVDMCIDDHVPDAAKLVLSRVCDPCVEEDKTKYTLCLKPAGRADKAIVATDDGVVLKGCDVEPVASFVAIAADV